MESFEETLDKTDMIKLPNAPIAVDGSESSAKIINTEESEAKVIEPLVRKKYKKTAGLQMILDDFHERKHIKFDEDSLFELVFATGGKEK